MPSQQARQLRGLLFKVVPSGWHRRKFFGLRFPFYFEQTNYSFDVHVGRVAAEDPNDPWPNNEIFFGIRFEDGSLERRPLPLPPIPLGKGLIIPFEDVYVAVPGQTTIVIVTNPGHAEKEPLEFLGLFSYRVRTEESMWISLAVGLFGLLSLFIAIFVPICTSLLNDPPVVYNNPIINVGLDTPTPTYTTTAMPSPESTLGTASTPTPVAP